jgi:hypothetical protein
VTNDNTQHHFQFIHLELIHQQETNFTQKYLPVIFPLPECIVNVKLFSIKLVIANNTNKLINSFRMNGKHLN